MSFTKIMVHAVWATKRRAPLLTKDIRPIIFDHIQTNALSKGIYIDRINGFTDHMHCLMDMNQEYSIGKTIQLIKGESAYWINKQRLTTSNFEWAVDYYAVSVDTSSLYQVRMYIQGQEVHHKRVNFQKEYEELMRGFNF